MRTWEENKNLINGLWPQHEFTPEEAKVFSADLERLDQKILEDAIVNVKRSHDTAWVHLKWFLEEYRQLKRAKGNAGGNDKYRGHKKLDLNIDPKENEKLRQHFLILIDESEPKDFSNVEKMVLDALPKMAAVTALRVLVYARARLLGETQRFGKPDDNGDIQPFFPADTPPARDDGRRRPGEAAGVEIRAGAV